MILFNYKNPLLIAEISGNHNQSKTRFLKLIDTAFKNGADLVKIQTYEPNDLTIKFFAGTPSFIRIDLILIALSSDNLLETSFTIAVTELRNTISSEKDRETLWE